MKKKSIKTTVAGVFAGGAIAWPEFEKLFDSDLTSMDWRQLFLSVAVIVLGIFCRDDNVSSEGATAMKNEPKPKTKVSS